MTSLKDLSIFLQSASGGDFVFRHRTDELRKHSIGTDFLACYGVQEHLQLL